MAFTLYHYSAMSYRPGVKALKAIGIFTPKALLKFGETVNIASLMNSRVLSTNMEAIQLLHLRSERRFDLMSRLSIQTKSRKCLRPQLCKCLCGLANSRTTQKLFICHKTLHTSCSHVFYTVPKNQKSDKGTIKIKDSVKENELNIKSPDEDDRRPHAKNVNRNSSPEVSSTSSWQKLKKFGTSFMVGLRQLWNDVKLARTIRKKLKAYDFDRTKLSRDELLHLQQTKKDVIKSAPITILFFVPFVGYLAPVLAYLYPKKLLSRQFWHPEQKQKFYLEDHARRSEFYLPLIREVGWACKESQDKALLAVVMMTLNGEHISNECLLERKESFEADEAISLSEMPRYHLVKLCQTWMIPARWYIPRKILMEGLSWRVKDILLDDDAIRRDGLSSLSELAIKQACHNRGLEESLYGPEALRTWLCEWVQLTAYVNQEHDLSFVAHCAVFKSVNFERFTSHASKQSNTIPTEAEH